MTDTDPRLEAVAKGWAAFRRPNLPWTLLGAHQRDEALYRAGEYIAMYDALCAFDQAQPASCADTSESQDQWRNQLIQTLAHFAIETGSAYWRAKIDRLLRKLRGVGVETEPKPESEVKSCPHPADNTTAPVMGADPLDTVIWSGEHKAWWRPDGCGYTPNVGEAGHWTLAEALHEIELCGPEKKLSVEHHVAVAVMGADPPWFEVCRKSVFGNADARFRDMQYQTMRALFAFANAQPPSEAEIDAAEQLLWSRGWNPTRQTIGDALIAATKSRSGT